MNQQEREGCCFPRGFKAAGISAGIKASGKPDLALIVSENPATACGVFTTNKIQAASVIVSKGHLANNRAKAVVISSGNANAATGKPGLVTAQSMCSAAATALGCEQEEILIAQTGLIGIPLNQTLASTGVTKASLELSDQGGLLAATAMMTTDTIPKMASEELFDGKVRIGGCAKGVAMLSPSMATMLGVITTDAKIKPSLLDRALREAVSQSFHALVVDGCRSTNDTVFILANEKSDYPEIVADSTDYNIFVKHLTSLCQKLAEKMAGDAEGATKLLRVHITGAHSKQDAQRAAMKIAGSILVKCSLAGEVMYWGRIISEIGASGAEIQADKIRIWYGQHEVCRDSLAFKHNEGAVKEYLQGRVIEITADLGVGDAIGLAYGSDLTHAYLDINMEKS